MKLIKDWILACAGMTERAWRWFYAWGQTDTGDTVIMLVMCSVFFAAGWRLCWELWARGVFK